MADYRLDSKAFEAELLCSDWMRAEMKSRAERAKTFAESIAPVGTEDDDLGHYKDSFSVSTGILRRPRGARVYAELSNSDPAAPYVEFGNGTEKFQGHHILTKSLDAMR